MPHKSQGVCFCLSSRLPTLSRLAQITNLAHENIEIKNEVREKGGIPPLVSLLEALDLKV